MRNRTWIAIAAGGALLVSGIVAPPASADDSTATFTVAAGSLTMAVDTNGVLGSATSTALGTSVSGTLSTITVTDARASIAGWTVYAKMSSDFYAVDGSGNMIDADTDGTADKTIAKGEATVTAGTGTVISGTAVFAPTLLGVAMTASDQILGSATTVGSNEVSFVNSIAVNIPSESLAGDYKGVVTQTLS